MARPDGRVEAGQRLDTAFSARAWNRAQDAADIVLGTRGGVQGEAVPTGPLPYTWVLAKNETGEDLPLWGGATIDGLVVEPDDTAGEAQFARLPIVTLATLAEDDQAWCVAVQPIKNNSIGRVAVAGVVQAKVTISDGDDQFLAAGDDDLVTGSSGEASILWKESGTGADKWALIRFGAGGGAGQLQLGKTTSSWPSGSTHNVVLYPNGTISSPEETITAQNKFAFVGADKWVMIGQAADGDWHLISAEC